MFGVGFFCDLPVHHIYSRRNVLPENLITVCYECHVKLHDGAFRNGVRPKLIPTKPLTSAMVELGKELDYWANSNWDYKKKLLNIRFDKYYKK